MLRTVPGTKHVLDNIYWTLLCKRKRRGQICLSFLRHWSGISHIFCGLIWEWLWEGSVGFLDVYAWGEWGLKIWGVYWRHSCGRIWSSRISGLARAPVQWPHYLHSNMLLPPEQETQGNSNSHFTTHLWKAKLGFTPTKPQISHLWNSNKTLAWNTWSNFIKKK